jgi:hypothetical protein
MGYRVDLEKHYYHPRTHKRLSQEKARAYMRRTGKRIKPQLWLTTRHTVGERSEYLSDATYSAAKKRAGRIDYTARLTRQEAILRSSSLAARHVRRTLGNHRVFNRLYEDFETPGDIQRRGAIRMTVTGTVDGRRIKEVIHLGFQRSVWEHGYRNHEHAREGFKDWLTAAVLTNLRRRGLRVSDPKESADRIQHLERERSAKVEMMDFTDDPKKRAGYMEQVRWATEAISRQKKSRQLRGVTIKVDKLI